MSIDEFMEIYKKFVIGFGVIIGLLILAFIYTRIRNDLREGGVNRVLFTLVKMGILGVILYFGIQYALDSGVVEQVYHVFYSK